MSDPNAEIDDETGDKIIGLVVAFALSLAHVLAFGWAGWVGDRRMDAVKDAFEGGLFFWSAGRDWSTPAVVAFFLPLALIPGAFGVQRRQIMPKLSPAGRWRLVLGVALAGVLAHGLDAWQTRRDLGVATASEVAWLHDGEVERRLTWSGATGVEVSCQMIQPRRGEPYPSLGYEVYFDGGRTAPLSEKADTDTSAWLDAVTPIDAALRAAAVPRTDLIDPRCLSAVIEAAGPYDAPRLNEVMRPQDRQIPG